MTDSARVFGDIYRNQVWGGGSGGGSVPEHVPQYIALVERLVREHRPKAVLDIGCGDCVLAGAIDWGSALYIGVDVVPNVIAQAGGRVKGGYVYRCDALTDDLPDADLVLVKEVTQHLDLPSVTRLLIKLSKYRMVLHTSMVYGDVNGPCEMGATRGIDIGRVPFIHNVENVLEYQIGESRYISQIWRPRA